MPVNVVVGAQFGGEGKGKIVAHLCRTRDIDLVVRCGGPNSGHTVFVDGERTILRQVPAGAVVGETQLALAAGCLIDLDVLREEIKRFGLGPDRVAIDPNATIIKPEYKRRERGVGLRDRIASTCTGTGVGVAERALRSEDIVKAADVGELDPYLQSTRELALSKEQDEGRVVIEGTQGFGLSLHHSPHYPYVTSRDTTAAAFLSEVGLPPNTVTDVTMVVRTYPIRVGGKSGPLPDEIDWETVREESGYPSTPQEFTSVTGTLRRIGRFQDEIVTKAAQANGPTAIAVHGLDYLDYGNKGVTVKPDLTDEALRFLRIVEELTETPVRFGGTGPKDSELLELGGD